MQLGISRGIGLPCRYACGRVYPEDVRDRAIMGSSIAALQRGRKARDEHERDEHGETWNAITEVARGVQRRPSVGYLHGGAFHPRAKAVGE